MGKYQVAGSGGWGGLGAAARGDPGGVIVGGGGGMWTLGALSALGGGSW